MNKKHPPSMMVATKNKNKVLSCSTPEHRSESPSRDSDSLCDSDAASPVPFLCTQDGAEGETDVVWNFYTPKSGHAASSRFKNSTPSQGRRKGKKTDLVEKPLPRRKPLRTTQKKTELFQDLLELNQNLHELIAKKSKNNHVTEKPQSGSEEDIFNDSGDSSPKSGLRTNTRCLRRNVLSSKFSKPEVETAMESDDSMNECLIKASQVVEENILNHEPRMSAKRTRLENSKINGLNSSLNFKMDQDSMDAILSSIKVDTPLLNKIKKCESPKLNNDSFDSFIGNFNDSALDRLTQAPIKNTTANRSKHNISKDAMDWTVQELVVHDGSPTSTIFGRHNSMPESPSFAELNKPSTSGMVFGRYNSMPFGKNSSNEGDSPIRCTPEEIKKKHLQAREKLHAKRLLPFTSSQQSSHSLPSQLTKQTTKKTQFIPRVASNAVKIQYKVPVIPKKNEAQQISSNNSENLKLMIEKKRQEALLKLRRRQPQNKLLS